MKINKWKRREMILCLLVVFGMVLRLFGKTYALEQSRESQDDRYSQLLYEYIHKDYELLTGLLPEEAEVIYQQIRSTDYSNIFEMIDREVFRENQSLDKYEKGCYLCDHYQEIKTSLIDIGLSALVNKN